MGSLDYYPQMYFISIIYTSITIFYAYGFPGDCCARSTEKTASTPRDLQQASYAQFVFTAFVHLTTSTTVLHHPATHLHGLDGVKEGRKAFN